VLEGGSVITRREHESGSIWGMLNPVSIARNLWRHRALIRQLTRREVESRYRGSLLGLVWSFINPLIMLVIYTFVFGVVFKARWSVAEPENLLQFALTLFCGLTAFSMFEQCVNRAPLLIVGVPSYVKKVVFPLEILPVVSAGAALFHASIGIVIVLIVNLIENGVFCWTIVVLPLVMIPLLFLTLGVAWFLSSLGVFVRDTSHLVMIIVQLLLYASAIFYRLDAVPPALRSLLKFNPLTSIVGNFRNVLLWGILPDWVSLGEWTLVTAAVMILGYGWFMKTKKAFADVL
jgi:lipopolysaccharide transport system permease protein